MRRALLPIATDNGACSESADVSYADLSISLSDQAQPFAALFRYRLYVDGTPQASFVDGRQRVYARCGEIDGGSRGGLEPGLHVVHFRAQVGDEHTRHQTCSWSCSARASRPPTPSMPAWPLQARS